MSLKSFHIFFISVSALFFFLFAAWLMLFNSFESSIWNVLAAFVCIGVGSLLVAYGVRFLKKFKHIDYM